VKQVLVRGGGVAVEEVPAPLLGPREILVRVAHSCVSVGTEISGVRLSGLPLYRRAIKQPQHVKRVLEVAREQGLLRTVQRVRGRLAAGLPTGYSAAGTVLEVGEDVAGFSVGDGVACAGAGIANHAELIAVPVNLAVAVPDGLDLRLASTVTLGAIALQGVRRAAPTLGETVGVIGLGIIGQITVQLLRANGCHVVGADLDRTRVEHALRSGMEVGVDASESFVERALRVTEGFGLDAVIVTAASASSEVLRQAMRSCRKKARVVVVGDVGMQVERADMYERELDLLMSTSYGPGRYDDSYEQDGIDYPLAYVRWTENRNLAEYLRCLADGRVSLAMLPSESYEIDRAPEAYAALQHEGPKPLLVTIAYPERAAARSPTVVLRRAPAKTGRVRVALVGAGSFAEAMHVPNLLKLRDEFEIRWVASRTGATAKAVALRSEAARATTDIDEVLRDPDVDLVLITTRHDTHATLALRALQAGKNVFVEKPLAIRRDELDAIERFYAGGRDAPLLMTGFNRRFAPAIVKAREILAARRTPLIVDYRMNAGYLPPTHWVHGPEGAGRNVGEACHIYDLFDALTGADVTSVGARAIHPRSGDLRRDDNFVASVSYADGSVCTLVYTALGHRGHPKERMEVFADSKVLSLDDYRSLEVAGGRTRGWRGATVDKGHLAELRALADCLRTGGAWPISLDEQLRAMRVAFAVQDQISSR
jgi:predicted dehydrogenase